MKVEEILECKQIKLDVFRNHPFYGTEEQIGRFVKAFESEDGYELMNWTCGIDEVEGVFEKILKEDYELAVAKCAKDGHDWEHSFDIGPESGSESVSCKNCGHGFSHTYY